MFNSLTGPAAVRCLNIDVTHLDDSIAVRRSAFNVWYTGIAQVNPASAARLGDSTVAGRCRCPTSSSHADLA